MLAKNKLAIGARAGEMVPVARLYLSTKEAMAYLDCKRDMLEGLRNTGAVRCSKIGKVCYWRLQDIVDMLEAGTLNGWLHKDWKRSHRKSKWDSESDEGD